MAEVPVYMVVNLVVRDAEEYRIYVNGFFPLLERHGGEFLTFDDWSVTLEGAAPREGRMVIFKFPSEDQAMRWYADPDYQSLSGHRRAGSQLEFLTLVHGMQSRGQ